MRAATTLQIEARTDLPDGAKCLHPRTAHTLPHRLRLQRQSPVEDGPRTATHEPPEQCKPRSCYLNYTHATLPHTFFCIYPQTQIGRNFWFLPIRQRAENETRTRDPNLGKVVLYQLSYFRRAFCRKTGRLLSNAVQKYNLFPKLQTFRRFFRIFIPFLKALLKGGFTF